MIGAVSDVTGQVLSTRNQCSIGGMFSNIDGTSVFIGVLSGALGGGLSKAFTKMAPKPKVRLKVRGPNYNRPKITSSDLDAMWYASSIAAGTQLGLQTSRRQAEGY
jgi:hypothetical protein